MRLGYIRIIGGKLKGRRLKIPATKSVRPTPDSVRETLFNWLAPVISGAKCLDLFAGSGALALEALSRGAKKVVMVDKSLQVIKVLRSTVSDLQLDSSCVQIIKAEIPKQNPFADQNFDVVFLDPPFSSALLKPACEFLEKHHLLVKNAYIYLEASEPISQNELPENWEILKHKKTGQVHYYLAQSLPYEIKTINR